MELYVFAPVQYEVLKQMDLTFRGLSVHPL